MSSTIFSATMTIMESTMTFPVVIPTGKLKLDRPRGIAESEALETFKSEVQGWQILNNADDYFFLRFLRARDLNVGKAKEMLKKYLEFRKTNKYLADICKKSYVPSEHIIQQIPFLKSGNDFDGRPVFAVQLGHTDLKGIFDRGLKEEVLRLGHFLLEFLVHASEVQRKQHGCTKVVGIVDLNGFSFRNAFHTHTVQSAVYAARTFESFYPELLHSAIVINANWIFNSLYNMMKPFLSEVTLEKLQVYGHEPHKWKHVLRKYVPANAIPTEYGGNSRSPQHGTLDSFEGFRVER